MSTVPTLEDSATTFIRDSKFRKSFRIRHRYNTKLPPAAILFMKSLEKNRVKKSDSMRKQSIFYTTVVDEPQNADTDISLAYEMEDPLVGDEQPLINTSPILKKCSSFKRLPAARKLKKFKKVFNFFKS